MTGRQLQTPRRGGRTETVTIAAGTARPFYGLGDRVNCIASTAPVSLQIDVTGEKLLFRTGTKYRMVHGDDYTSFSLINESGAPITVTLYYGYIDFEDDQTIITGSLSAPDGIRDTADTVVNVGALLTIAADAARRSIIIFNNSSSDRLRIGDPATVGDARGMPIPPNSMVSLDTAAAVGIWNPTTSGGTVTVSIAETYEA